MIWYSQIRRMRGEGEKREDPPVLVEETRRVGIQMER